MNPSSVTSEDSNINFSDYNFQYLMKNYNSVEFRTTIDSKFIESLRDYNYDTEIAMLQPQTYIDSHRPKNGPSQMTSEMSTGYIYCEDKDTYFNFTIWNSSEGVYEVNMKRHDFLKN